MPAVAGQNAGAVACTRSCHRVRNKPAGQIDVPRAGVGAAWQTGATGALHARPSPPKSASLGQSWLDGPILHHHPSISGGPPKQPQEDHHPGQFRRRVQLLNRKPGSYCAQSKLAVNQRDLGSRRPVFRLDVPKRQAHAGASATNPATFKELAHLGCAGLCLPQPWLIQRPIRPVHGIEQTALPTPEGPPGYSVYPAFHDISCASPVARWRDHL